MSKVYHFIKTKALCNYRLYTLNGSYKIFTSTYVLKTVVELCEFYNLNCIAKPRAIKCKKHTILDPLLLISKCANISAESKCDKICTNISFPAIQCNTINNKSSTDKIFVVHQNISKCREDSCVLLQKGHIICNKAIKILYCGNFAAYGTYIIRDTTLNCNVAAA